MPLHRFSRALLLSLACVGGLSTALAQTDPAPTSPAPTNLAPTKSKTSKPAAKKTAAAKPAHPKFNPYQSPLATIMQSHLRADVPEAQDFVRESRPAKQDLKYTPLQSQLGPDPVRPKPRDAANVSALQAELEASIAHNDARVGRKSKAKPHLTKPDAN